MDRGGQGGSPAVTATQLPAGPVLLYDGTCGLCDAGVQWMLRRDRHARLRFAPLHGETAALIRRAHPHIDRVDSMVWLEPAREGGAARVFVQSDAAIRAAAYLGGVWSAARMALLVPRPLRDAVYAFIARHRHQIVGADRCDVNLPADRARFLP